MNPSFSIIRVHSLDNDYVYEDDLKSFYRTRDISEGRIAESIFIHKNRPILNN